MKLGIIDSTRKKAGAPAPSYPTDNLLSYYRFDETSGTTAEDSYGSNDLTTISGYQNSGGKNNYCYRAINTNYDAVAGSRTPFDFARTDSFSFSCWVKRQATGDQYNNIISKMYAAWLQGYQLEFNSDAVVIILYSGGNVATKYTTNVQYDSTANYYHIVATYAGTGNHGGMYIYVDGELVEQSGTTPYGNLQGTMQNTSIFTIGDKWHGAGEPLKGLIDEVGIFNRVLTLEDVQSIYAGGAGLYY